MKKRKFHNTVHRILNMIVKNSSKLHKKLLHDFLRNGVLYDIYTVEPVLRCHLWYKEKVAYKTGDLLKEVQFI